MKPLSQQAQMFQNIGMGPHLPLVAVPPVYTGFWAEADWARWMGLDVETYRLVCRIEAGRVR